MESYQRIAQEIRSKLGLLGNLTTFRVSKMFMKTFGAGIDKMTIWRAEQKTGGEISFSLDPQGELRGEADGTGIGIRELKKRDKKLKVLIQCMKGQAIRVVGIDIGPYNGSWDRLFRQKLKVLKTFKRFLLIKD